MTMWRLVPFIAAALVLAPIGVIVSSFFAPASDIWQHLVETTLPLSLVNTFWLALGVITGTAFLGISLAWFTAVYEFPGRNFFSWALLLPLAMPAYVTAFVALGLFDFTGPLQTALRAWLDSDLSWFPDIRGRAGVICKKKRSTYLIMHLIMFLRFIKKSKKNTTICTFFTIYKFESLVPLY